jgi:zinc transport system permease protein
MEILQDIFQYQFLGRALLAALLTSVSCGIIGTYIVSKRIVFLSGGITHASFGGIGIGYYLGINPIIGASLFAVLTALGVEFFTKKAEIREDSAIGIWWSFGMALGIIFIFITPGYAPNLMSYLFGSILTVTNLDLYLLLALTLLMILFFILFFKVILYVSFDPGYAKTYRAPVQLISYSLLALVALTIVFNIRVMGIILIISLLTIPQTIANSFTRNFRNIIIVSIIIALVGCFSGLVLSYAFNIPSGASIIIILVIMFAISKIYRRLLKYRQLKKIG